MGKLDQLRSLPRRSIGKPKPAKAAAKKGKPPKEASTRGKVKGELVGTRFQPDLLKRLDKAKGDMTRPEKIRDVLDKALP